MEFIFFSLAIICHPEANPTKVDVFTSGKQGYHTYRIPSAIQSGNRLLLFAEGRKLSSSDHGWNDIVMKESFDLGYSWSDLKIVYGESKPGKDVCIGNPSPISLSSGNIVLVACRNNEDVIVLRSTDQGSSWSEPYDITNQVKDSNWSWVATGPPQGLELESGRIVVAADHVASNVEWGSHAMFSDDEGKTWKVSNSLEGGNECQVAKLSNGSLIMNMRTRIGLRQFSWSHDNAEHWSTPTTAPFAFSGKYGGGSCEGSTISIPERNLLLFSTPFAEGRENMTVFQSQTGGESWEVYRNIDTGPSAYSALISLNSTHFGLFYESKSYGAITFVALMLPPISR